MKRDTGGETPASPIPNLVRAFQNTMKQGIHPQWNHQAVVICACGNKFTTGSAQEEIHVDICSNCHPFFTGEMKFVDRQGRVDKFMQKMSAAQAKQAAAAAKKKTKAAETPVVETDENGEPLSYKQLLQQEQTKLKNIAQQRQKAVKAA